MENCIFCKIAKGEIPSNFVYEDDKICAFKDINPVAPVHVLIIPKTHIASAMELNDDNSGIVAHIFACAGKIAKIMGVDESGFRIVNNCGKDGGQTVGHLHFHLIGGKELLWP
ncbi:MAG: histidine triad nucleotide-binding protein [Ruminococcaceae bacterium]|nr:histidine triad nucleotide-binding protein [Oscillospiraceae bacterium]